MHCPLSGCANTSQDTRRFAEHLKIEHASSQSQTSQAENGNMGTILVPSTPPAAPVLSERHHPYKPSSNTSVHTSSPLEQFSSYPHSQSSHPQSTDSLPPVYLDGSMSYLETNKIFDFLGLRYHTHFKVLLCVCGTALLPEACITHVKHHGVKLIDTSQIDFDHAVAALDVATTTSMVQVPPPGGPPVEILTVIKNGHCCNVCNYCSPKKKSLNNHWYATHGKERTLAPELRYHMGAIQSFFIVLGDHYFEVNPTLTQLPADDIFAIYMRDEVSKFTPFPATLPTHPNEVPPLLQVTQWHVHLAAYTEDYRKRDALRSLVTLPSHSTPTGIGHLGDVAFEYLKEIRDKASQSTLAMRHLLMECPR